MGRTKGSFPSFTGRQLFKLRVMARQRLWLKCLEIYCGSEVEEDSARQKKPVESCSLRWLFIESAHRAHPIQGRERGVLGRQQEVAHVRRVEHVGANGRIQRGKQTFLTQPFGLHVTP